MHSCAEYYDYAIPDFISVKIGDFGDGSPYAQKRREYALPVLGWTVTEENYLKFTKLKKEYDGLLIEFDPQTI